MVSDWHYYFLYIYSLNCAFVHDESVAAWPGYQREAVVDEDDDGREAE